MAVAPLAVEVVDATVVGVLVVVVVVAGAAVVVVTLVVLELELEDLVVDEEDVTGVVVEPDPDPIAVVMGPDSMYTPLTYQSSIPAWFTMRKTPTWKSSEFWAKEKPVRDD